MITWELIQETVENLKLLYFLVNENIDKGIGLLALVSRLLHAMIF
jgi:hypothetical protein